MTDHLLFLLLIIVLLARKVRITIETGVGLWLVQVEVGSPGSSIEARQAVDRKTRRSILAAPEVRGRRRHAGRISRGDAGGICPR